MFDSSLSQLGDGDLLRVLAALAAQERFAIAKLLALIGEVDRRRLYAAAGYSSMHGYCVGELHLSEDAAWRRIQAARTARRFPVLLHLLAAGKLHLTAVCMLAPHMTAENERELVESATHRRRSEIERMLALRFPLTVEPVKDRPVVRALPALPAVPAPARVNPLTLDTMLDASGSGMVDASGSARGSGDTHDDQAKLSEPCGASEIPSLQLGESPESLERKTADSPFGQSSEPPSSQERYLVKLTIEKSTHDKLRYAQTLLSHAVRSRDVAEIIDRALDALITRLEKDKLGACIRQPAVAPTTSTRHIPAHVRRAVWRRDQAQCTFVSSDGHRCAARHLLEFDHVVPVAKGGRATPDGIRLRCRAHNQYEAERVFGAEFMARKRGEEQRQR